MSMAAGEYVSVSSQADTEHADVNRERSELATDTAAERKELTQIYVRRGLDRETAESVARQLMVRDALGAHTRDELGILEMTTARPIQAAFTSAATFTCGAALPRSEEHTSELQSLMRISYAVFCLKKKNQSTITHKTIH